MDTKGKTRMGFGVTQKGGGLSVLDRETKERVGISAPETGPVIVLKDDKGKDLFKQP
jgi:hypothetical protein